MNFKDAIIIFVATCCVVTGAACGIVGGACGIAFTSVAIHLIAD